MRISFNWLTQFIGADFQAQTIADRLSVSGLEVEHLEIAESVPGGLRGFVIGEVKTCEKHPNADKLSVTTVDIGTGELQPIVCGAPNVAAGQKVIVAIPGTEVTVPGKGSFTIGEAKIRGEISRGMICADDECGLGTSHDGIRILPADAPVGVPAAEYFKVTSDTVLDIGLTANRGDAASHLGVARDVAALFNVPVTLPQVPAFSGNPSGFNIHIQSLELCQRYVAVEIKGVTITQAPAWMQDHLRSIGVEPINHVVDCTNYVLHELGQPLHAFDADSIQGKQLNVRMASHGETLTTLDKSARELNEQDLIIADAAGPIALAGVFGGLSSSVQQHTTNIMLESACFHPGKVRKTARHHGLNTDASFRFERGTDVEICRYAALRAAHLITDIGGGEIIGLSDHYPVPFQTQPINLNLDKFRRYAGIDIDDESCLNILSQLGFGITPMGEKNYHIGTPSWRNDIEHEVDLVEEIMRIYGFDHVPMDGKMQVSLGSFSGTGQRKLKEKAARALQSTGFFEIVNNSLGSQAAQQAFSEQPVQLSNPLSSDMAVMRSSLLPGMLQSAQYNRNRKNTDLKFYEFGRVYRSVKNGFEETEMLGMLMLGNATAESWQQKPKKLDFYDLKEASQAVMYATGSCPEPGSWNLSRVNSQLAQQYDIEGDCWYAEIAWSAIAGNKRPEGFKTAEPPRFPRMRRDLSLVVGKSVAYGDLEKIALSKKIGILQEINVFDVFEGKPLDADKKAVAISFSLGVADRTLTDVEADEAMKTLMTAFEQEAGALIRK